VELVLFDAATFLNNSESKPDQLEVLLRIGIGVV